MLLLVPSPTAQANLDAHQADAENPHAVTLAQAATPQAHIADPAGGVLEDAQARSAVAAILDLLIAQNLMAAS